LRQPCNTSLQLDLAKHGIKGPGGIRTPLWWSPARRNARHHPLSTGECSSSSPADDKPFHEPVPQFRTSSEEHLRGSRPVASETPVASSDHHRIDGGRRRRRRVESASRLDITSLAGLLTSDLRSKSLLFAGRIPSGHPPGRLTVTENSDAGR
jgi:hypothetical protein